MVTNGCNSVLCSEHWIQGFDSPLLHMDENWFEEIEILDDNSVADELWQLDDEGNREFLVRRDILIVV